MKQSLAVVLALIFLQPAFSQKMSVAQMKKNMEASPNPVGYVREVLKKQYKLDTIIVFNKTHFTGIADSLAYYGKLKKVYGPFDKKYLVQVLAKLPNQFTRISQIFIDTTLFSHRVADSIGSSIITRINNGSTSFEDMAQVYSMGGEGATRGDLGWIARGALVPEIEKELARHKKGEVIKIWSANGLHIVKKTSDPKLDNGFALILRVML
jgi:hypothetical protein